MQAIEVVNKLRSRRKRWVWADF